MTKRMTDRPALLYIDQYGQKVWARTVRELKDKAGPGRVFKIYCDMVRGPNAGKSCHTGYGVGHRWFTAFIPYQVPQ